MEDAADLLTSHEDEQRPRRRSWLAVGVLAALAGALLLATDRREAAQLERQEAAAVDLGLVAFASERRRYDDATDAFELELVLQLRNDGAGTVTVLRGGLGGYGLDRDVELAPGERAELPLTRSVRCGAPAPEPAADTLALTVGTADGTREVRLPVPFELPGGAARACGFLPLEDAVTATVLDVETRRGSLRLAVDVRTVANRPLAVVGAVAVDPGVDAVLEEQPPVTLPLPQPGGTGLHRLHVVLTVADCTAAAGLPGAPASRAVRLVVQEPDGGSVMPRVGYDPALLAALVAQAC